MLNLKHIYLTNMFTLPSKLHASIQLIKRKYFDIGIVRESELWFFASLASYFKDKGEEGICQQTAKMFEPTNRNQLVIWYFFANCWKTWRNLFRVNFFLRPNHDEDGKRNFYRILKQFYTMGICFLGVGYRPFWKVINMFACTCPNFPGVGAIDNLDRFEQVFDTYYIPEASEKIFTDGILMVHPQKMYIFGF